MTPTENLPIYANTLLVHYCFELRGHNAEELVQSWCDRYQVKWVMLAIIEALYQGRYKAVSVEQILAVWQRRGQAIHHFNHDFERLVCRKIPHLGIGDWGLANGYWEGEALENVEVTSAESYEEIQVDFAQSSLSDSEENLSVIPAIFQEQANIESEESISKNLALTLDCTLSISLVKTSNSQQDNWSRWDANKHPIHQFTPKDSNFYLKLKALSQTELDVPANVSPNIFVSSSIDDVK